MKCCGRAFIPEMGILSSLPVLGSETGGWGQGEMPSSGPRCKESSCVWRLVRDRVILVRGPVSACHLPCVWGQDTKNLCDFAACRGQSVRERGAVASSRGNPSASPKESEGFLLSPAPSQGPAHLPLPRDRLSAAPCSCRRAPAIGTVL